MSAGIPWPRVLAEGVAIVVSILLAFGIQAWWEDRQDRTLEASYLNRLIIDLQADTSTFRLVTDLASEKEQALLAVGPFLLNPSRSLLDIAPTTSDDGVVLTDTAAFLQHLVTGASLGWQEPRARRTTYEELQNTGNLRLIRDGDVRDALNTYYQALEDEYRRVDRRRGSYPALTYELIPRGVATAVSRRRSTTTEFVVATDLMGGSAAGVVEVLRRSNVYPAAVAERNFASFTQQAHVRLIDSAIELLDALKEAARLDG